MTTENAYAAPSADLIDENQQQENAQFFSVSKRKLVVMLLLTFNMYSVYWFYKHWQLQRLHANQDCMPVLRAIFSIFFVYSFFSIVHEQAKMRQMTPPWGAGIQATVFILCFISSTICGQFQEMPEVGFMFGLGAIGLSLLAIVPMVKVQGTVNVLLDDEKGLKNNHFTWINWIFMILGILFWLTTLFGFYVVANGGAV